MLSANKSTAVRRYHQGRVRRLLEHLRYPGLVAEVRAEGVFIQLDEQGVPARQVFLAITHNDLIIVKQENVDAEPPGPVKTPMDIFGLSLDHVIPLAVLSFFTLDDRARRLTVGTCLDVLFYFEMCQFDVDIDTAWRKWREIVLDIGGEQEGTFGIQIWHSSSEVGLAKQRHSLCIGDSMFVDTKPHTMQYIHHPHAFSQVRSVGVQTNFPKTPLCNPAFRQHRQGFSFGKRKGKLSVVLSRSRFEDHPTRSCDIQKSKSSVNIDHSHFPENWQASQSVLSVLCFEISLSILMQTLDTCMADVLFKRRPKLTVKSYLEAVDTGSDSDEGVFSAVQDAKDMQHRQTDGRTLWKRARYRLLGRTPVNARGRLFHETVALTYKSRFLALTVLELQPEALAAQLTDIARALVLAISPGDLLTFSASRGEKVPESLEAVLDYENQISKMVVTEVIKNFHDRGVEAVKFFIQVCTSLLFQYRDFQSLVAVLRGLTSLPLYRLHVLWDSLICLEPHSFSQLLAMLPLVSVSESCRSYCERLRFCILTNKLFIPWMEHFLAHVLSSKSTNAFQPNNNDTLAVQRSSSAFLRATYSISKSICKSLREIKGFIKTPLRKKPGVAQRNKQEERKGEIVTFKTKKNENTSDTGNAMVTLTNTSRFEKKVKENDETTEKFVQDSSGGVSDSEDSSCDSDSTDSDAEISKGSYNEREVQMEVQLYAQVKARNIIESALNALASNIEHHQNVEIDEKPTPDISSTYAKDDKIGSTSSSVSVSTDLLDISAENTPLMVQYSGKPYAMVLHELCKRMDTISDLREAGGTTITSKAQLHFDNRSSNEARNEDISDQMQIIARNKTDLIPKEAINSIVENKFPEKKIYSANICQKEMRKQDKQKVEKNTKTKKNKGTTGNKVFKKLKTAFKRKKPINVDYVNALQNDIQDIEELMSSFKTFNEEDSQTNDGSSDENTKREGFLEAASFQCHPLELKSTIQGRKKSPFQQALDEHNSEQEENQTFESMKASQLDLLRKKGSIVLDLLESDANSYSPVQHEKGNPKEEEVNSQKVNVKDFVKYFERKPNDENNNSPISHYELSGRSSFADDMSTIENKSNMNVCKCCNSERRYFYGDFLKMFSLFQRKANEVPVSWNDGAKLCLQAILTVNTHLNWWDIMQLSLSCKQ